MKNTKATLLSIGAAIASAKLSRAISTLELGERVNAMHRGLGADPTPPG
jgi:hypothetical protein